MDSRKPDLTLVRFDRVERFAHWMTASLFAILMLTALPLYFTQVEAWVGRRLLFAEIHTWIGIFLPVPLLISLTGSWGSNLRADVSGFNLWTKEEIKWLQQIGRNPTIEMGKFNPGQKLNALFIGSSMAVMLGTGLILRWFNLFPLGWRTGATFVHDSLAFAIVLVVIGHVVFALAHREALKSMLSGRVSREWASAHAPKWFREQGNFQNGELTGPYDKSLSPDLRDDHLPSCE